MKVSARHTILAACVLTAGTVFFPARAQGVNPPAVPQVQEADLVAEIDALDEDVGRVVAEQIRDAVDLAIREEIEPAR